MSFFLFSEKIVFNEDNPSQKVVIIEEELDTDIDDIGNSDDLPILAVTDEEYRNSKVVN